MSRTEPRDEPLAPADDAIARHREELKKRFPLQPPARKPKRRGSGTLGMLVAALAIGGGLVWLDPAYRSEEHASTLGQVQSVELGDGSVITLDGASRIRVSWHLRSRRVELQAGQALFAVAPMTYRPFLTQVGAAEIRVVGTRYNVSRDRDDVRVTVAEGRVAVRGTGAEQLLLPGDQVQVRAGRLGAMTRVDSRNVTAWTEGRLVFDRTPLGEVLGALQRYRDTSVRLGDPTLAELPVSGTFDSDRLDGLMPLLLKVLPLELSTAADGSLQLDRRGAKK